MVAVAESALTPRWTPLRPHATQYALWTSEALYNVVEAGRRSGKSELAKRRGVEAATSHHARSSLPDGHYKFGAPTRDQAKRIYWDDLKLLVPRRLVLKISETELTIRLRNGATIYVVGLDAAERIEGQPMDWFFGDEAQEWKRGIWDKTIWPALQTDGRNGRAWIYGVPRPGAEFEELARRAKREKPGGEWRYFKWRSEDILGREKLAGAMANMDERVFAQEFGADRVPVSGRAYYQFALDVHARERISHWYNKRSPLDISLDFNVEPGVAAISQRFLFRDASELRLDRPEVADIVDGFIGEVWIPVDSNTHRVCRKIIEDWGRHEGMIHVYGDPSGGQRKSSAEGETDWSIVRDELSRHFGSDRVQLRVAASHPAVRERINTVNWALRSADGKVRTLVDPERCPKIVEDLDGVLVLKGTAGEIDKKRDETKTHLSDGIGYRAHYVYGRQNEIGGAPL